AVGGRAGGGEGAGGGGGCVGGEGLVGRRTRRWSRHSPSASGSRSASEDERSGAGGQARTGPGERPRISAARPPPCRPLFLGIRLTCLRAGRAVVASLDLFRGHRQPRLRRRCT